MHVHRFLSIDIQKHMYIDSEDTFYAVFMSIFSKYYRKNVFKTFHTSLSLEDGGELS